MAMADKQQIPWGKRAAPYVTAALALDVVGLFGFAYLTDSHLPGISPLAAVSIFIDGTKDIIPTDDSQAPDRMRDALNGAFDQCGATSTGPCANNVYIDYSRDFGILTQGEGYDESKAEATNLTIQAIRDAQADPTYTKGDGIYVVGYSQGANASSDVIKKAQELNNDNNPTNDLDLSDVTFVMLGNGARNDGGLWARLPAGVYVPFLGLSFGASTNPIQPTDDPNAPNVILVSKMYDGASDVPKYVLTNPVAALNSIMGFLYVHNGYYADVDIDLNNDGKVDDADVALAEADDAHYIVTKNGNVIDILIKNQPGDLPITQPLKGLGVPESFIKAIDPFLRAMIDAAYERPTDGMYPAEPVHIGLFPHPGKLFSDFHAIAAGAEETGEALGELATESAVGNALSKQGTALAKRGTVASAAAPAPPASPKPQSRWTPSLHHFVPPMTPQAPQPLAEKKFVAAAVEESAPLVVEEEPRVVQKGNTSGGTQTNVRGPIGGSPSLSGPKKIVTAINGVVTGIQNALTPKPASSPTTTTNTTDTDNDTGTDTGTDTG